MDEIIKLLMNMGKTKDEALKLVGKDVPKGGIDDVSSNILKPLTKKAVGDFPLIGSKITDPTSVKNFDFKSISESIADQETNWKKTFEFLREGKYNLSNLQKQNLNYNLGVLQRSKNTAKDLQKTINEQKAAPSNVYDLEKNLLDPNEPIMGGTQVKESYKKDELLPIDKKISDTEKQFNKDVEEAGGMEAFLDANPISDNIPKKAGKGQFTKAEYLIQRLRNTIKENPDDAYVQENFPNFIKELEANPDLAKNENVFKELGGDLPSDQKITVYDDNTLDFAKLKPTKSFWLNANKFKEDFNVTDEEIEKILKLSPDEQQKVLQEYIDKDLKQKAELMDFEPPEGGQGNAQGGLI